MPPAAGLFSTVIYSLCFCLHSFGFVYASKNAPAAGVGRDCILSASNCKERMSQRYIVSQTAQIRRFFLFSPNILYKITKPTSFYIYKNAFL